MQWAMPMLATWSADAGHHFWRSRCALELLLFLWAAIFSIFCHFGIAKLVSMVHEHVIIIGDSFLNRLKHYLSEQYGDVSAMNLFSFGAAVCWQTKGGLALQKLHRYHGRALSKMAPFNAAVLQIGGNDLCTLTPRISSWNIYVNKLCQCWEDLVVSRSWWPRYSTAMLDRIHTTTTSICTVHVWIMLTVNSSEYWSVTMTMVWSTGHTVTLPDMGASQGQSGTKMGCILTGRWWIIITDPCEGQSCN